MPMKSSEVIAVRGDDGAHYRVRCMTPEDFPQLMEIRSELLIHDVESCIDSWMAVDPKGINILETEEGEMVGCCATIKNAEDLFFLGLYCIRPKYQGSGLAIHVWNACMRHVGSTNCALNAVPGKTEMYRDKAGFPIVETEFKIQKNFTPERVNPKNLSNIIPQGVTIEDVQDYHLQALFEYDISIVGFDRKLALVLNCQEENSRTLVAVKNGTCVGFGSIKLTGMGARRVGPLYADDPAVAEALMRRLLMFMPHVAGFVMNNPTDNVVAKKLLKKLGVPKHEDLTRLYTKKKLSVDTKKIFALYDAGMTPF